MEELRPPWPHAPVHRLSERDALLVTASTYLKEHHFRGARRLAVLHRGLLTVASRFNWQLLAWAVFSNHYHFVAHCPADAPDASSLGAMLRLLHVRTAASVNRLDTAPGRRVWFNFWDTRLTHQRSYLARLNYVHQNAVKHGLVPVACQYPWCSALWFERTASRAMVKAIYRFKTDRLSVPDGFEPSTDLARWLKAPEAWRTPRRFASAIARRGAGRLGLRRPSRRSRAKRQRYSALHDASRDSSPGAALAVLDCGGPSRRSCPRRRLTPPRS